jgi:membrane protease YdiL (CAAX protease family)
MSTIGAFIKRHSLWTYYVLTFGISWGGILIVAGPDRIPATPDEFNSLFPLALLGLLGGPAIAGLLVTLVVYGRAGLRELFSRLRTSSVGPRWYGVALLTAPLVMAAVPLALSFGWPEYLPRIFTSADKVSLLATGISAGLLGGFLEELGWTGFAIPEFRKSRSLLATGLIVGCLWGAWHILMNIWSSGDSSGTLATTLFLHSFIFSVGILPAYRVLMVWVYDQTRSLLLAMLMHMALIVGNVLFVPQAIGEVPGPIWSLVTAVAMWIIVGVVLAANRGQPQARAQTEAPAS